MENETTKNMSEGMKAYWANMTPEQRSLRNQISAKKRKNKGGYFAKLSEAVRNGEEWAIAKSMEIKAAAARARWKNAE